MKAARYSKKKMEAWKKIRGFKKTARSQKKEYFDGAIEVIEGKKGKKEKSRNALKMLPFVGFQ